MDRHSLGAGESRYPERAGINLHDLETRTLRGTPQRKQPATAPMLICPAPRPQGSTAARAASLSGISPWTLALMDEAPPQPRGSTQTAGTPIQGTIRLLPRPRGSTSRLACAASSWRLPPRPREQTSRLPFMLRKDNPTPPPRGSTRIRRRLDYGVSSGARRRPTSKLSPKKRRPRNPRPQGNNITRPPWQTEGHAAPSPRINEPPEIPGINLPHTLVNAGIAALPRERGNQPSIVLALIERTSHSNTGINRMGAHS